MHSGIIITMGKISWNPKPGVVGGKYGSPKKAKSEIWYTMQLSGACASKIVIKAINKWLEKNYTGDWMYKNTGYGINVIFSFPNKDMIINEELSRLIEHETVLAKIAG